MLDAIGNGRVNDRVPVELVRNHLVVGLEEVLVDANLFIE